MFLLIKLGEESMGVRGIVKKQGLSWWHKRKIARNISDMISDVDIYSLDYESS